ncbi:tetratricopeptide repeat protein [Candidatus Pelagibacter sp. HIMB1483]|jgi:tetratricopeptide (TPR) repeat protein|uniref:tetratricopeptide repeat protein n=1 Tax=Candidatus Pelagibacter sp. HIMB1483 TaxID=3415414 RepID=UPI003F82B023
MLLKKIKFILILVLLYQTPLFSKSNSLEKIDSKNLSKYFSGIVAFGNKKNSEALKFFDSSKVLINKHDPFLKRYVSSLVLENKVSQAINIVRQNKDENNTQFFDAYLLIFLDSLKKNDLELAFQYILDAFNYSEQDRFNLAILESLKQYVYLFKEKEFLDNKQNFGKLSIISETFQRCYLKDPKTENYFLNLINDPESDFTRYIYFYLSFLIENNELAKAKKITDDLEYINSTLLLSQGKSWIENKNFDNFAKVFSCKNHNDLIAEFLFLISNLYSSQDNFEMSNFYLNLSNFLNPKFKFNLSLVAENHYLNQDYDKAKKVLKKFTEEEDFYYWYRLKKEAQIIEKQRNIQESLNYITSNFKKIDNPNKKILFDIANFYKKSKNYEEAINYYTKIINDLDDSAEIKSDILYRRGGSYERIKNYEASDKDLQNALKITPDDAYILNYLAYSWLERDYKIDEAIDMLKIAYRAKNDDPYIIDSLGWAYYLIDDYLQAEKLLKRAVELMPDDPIVNDHYGDILWKLDRKIQARYFWKNVLDMNDTEEEMIEKINIKIIQGLNS